MTQVLTKVAPLQPTTFDDVDRSATTIAAYDRSAADHANRLASADFLPYLRRFASTLVPDAVVLDGGCGAGRDLAWFAAAGYRTIGLDLSAGMLAQARHVAPAATLIHADLRDVPLPDDSVDGGWLCASLLHLGPVDASAALQEVRRVLTPGGRVFISTAAGHGSYWRPSELGARWFQLYTETDLVDLVQETGLRVVESVTEPGVVLGNWVNLTACKPA